MTAGVKPSIVLANDLSRPSLVAFSPDGRLAALADADGAFRLFELSNSKELARTSVSGFHPNALALAPGRRVVAASPESGIRVWDAASGEVRREHLPDPRAVALSSDGLMAVWVGRGGAGARRNARRRCP